MSFQLAFDSATQPVDLNQVQLPLAEIERRALDEAFRDRPERLHHYVMRSMTISLAELAVETRYAQMAREARQQIAA